MKFASVPMFLLLSWASWAQQIPIFLSVQTSAELPVGFTGAAYSQTLVAVNGAPPYFWQVTSGSLPGGLALSLVGVISGAPTTPGTSTFQVMVMDSLTATAYQTFTLTVFPGPPHVVIKVISLAQASIGSVYATAALTALGGVAPYKWAVTSGTLPAGITLSAAGVFSGTPTPAALTSTFTVTATDAASATASQSFTINVPLTILTNSYVGSAVLGSPVSMSLAAGGGRPPYTWQLSSGALPPGLSLGSSGTLAGTPAQSGSYTFSAFVVDASGTSVSRTFLLSVAAPPLTIVTSTALPPGAVGIPYSRSFTAGGGAPPYSWFLASGSLPPGFSLSSAGVISGTPAGPGAYVFGVTVRDSSGQSLSRAFTLSISVPPVIYSVKDASSLSPTLGSPGEIAYIFGANLATTTAGAQDFPLPRQLGGAGVTWNGVAAPLFSVSPTRITFQIPSGGSSPPGPGAASAVVVSAGGIDSAAFNPAGDVAATKYAAGLFTQDGSGCGQSVAVNYAADGSVTINSPSNSAQPGNWISVYGTGINPAADNAPADGVAAPMNPLIPVKATLQFDLPGIAATESWSGLAPGWAGLNQFNARIPDNVREGCAVPLQVAYSVNSQAISAPVTLAIRNGGGVCADPPSAGYGQITFEKTVSTSYSNLATESATFKAFLDAAPGKQAPLNPAITDGCPPPSRTCTALVPAAAPPRGPSCSVPGYRSLAAGTLTVQGPGLSPTVAPSLLMDQGQLSGVSSYQATLAAGTLQPGDYVVSASGGADVAAFQVSARVGPDIQIQTPLAGVGLLTGCAPLTIVWSGGDPDSWVTVTLTRPAASDSSGSQSTSVSYRTRASNGSLTVPAAPSGSAAVCPLVLTPGVVTVEVSPDPSAMSVFSAPGLSLGGRVYWRYVHAYQAYIGIQ